MREIVGLAKALADEGRLRVLCALKGRELCVCQITELLQLAPSTVSKHMTILHQARLVETRKEGRWMYYRLASGAAPAAVRGAMAWALRALSGADRARRDARNLAAILRRRPEELCRRQCAVRKRAKGSRP